MGHRTLTVKLKSGQPTSYVTSVSPYPTYNAPEEAKEEPKLNNYTDEFSIEYFKSMSPVVCLKKI